ncbi:MAG TPA: hypothetical protein VHG92_06640 [Afifellaceae bacterium]|nr:hypothetical protein [Afifellaceae bacterium]
MIRCLAALTAAGLLSTGCGTAARQDYLNYRANEEPTRLAARLTERVRSCWFAEDEQGFAGHLYVPELNSFSGRPRILIVRASEPTGLPRLVIQAAAANSGAEVRLFGPMLGETPGRRIERDVARWVGGARDC